MYNTLLPQHVAVIMDGNGRWGQRRMLPRITGYSKGIDATRAIVQHCVEIKLPVLTLFAFSSENWRRPQSEVSFLMSILKKMLSDEVEQLHENNVKLKIIGEVKKLDMQLQSAINKAQLLTANNTGLQLNIALSYGGRWDITTAAKNLCKEVMAGNLTLDDINEDLFGQYVSLSKLPAPDLLIRTSGEQRISNFLLWQIAYSELYFSPTLWPDFQVKDFEKALEFYRSRERRYGLVTEYAETANS